MIELSLRGIYIIDTSGNLPYRQQKYCVCVSVCANKYLLINTQHREMYDDFKISASGYDFLNGVDRFLACSRLLTFDQSKLIQKVGALSDVDTNTVIEKIAASNKIRVADKITINNELQKL